MARFTYKYLKPVALFLAIAVLFQCCKVYDKQPVTLEQAMTKTKMMIITTDDKIIIVDDIYYKNDSLLYGLMTKKTRDTIVSIVPKELIKEHIYESGKHGPTEKIITMDGEIYDFDSYSIYSQNDTLYLVQKVRLNKEILIPILTIKEIRLFNKKKSKRGTFWSVTVGLGITVFGLMIIGITSGGGWDGGI